MEEEATYVQLHMGNSPVSLPSDRSWTAENIINAKDMLGLDRTHSHSATNQVCDWESHEGLTSTKKKKIYIYIYIYTVYSINGLS